MIIDFKTCPLTGIGIRENEVTTVEENYLQIRYKNQVLGEVIMPKTLFTLLEHEKYKELFPIIVGIVRENYTKFKKPFELNSPFFENGYKEFTYPKNFDEKAIHFLNYLSDSGGKEYKSLRVYPDFDYPLAYAINKEEFSRILYKLKNDEFIEFNSINKLEGNVISSIDILLTKKGIAEF